MNIFNQVFSISMISSFKIIEGKHDANRRRDCRKKNCQFLREHAMKIVNFKKKSKLLRKGHQESYQMQIISKEKLKSRYMKDKKVNLIFIIQENIEVLHITYSIYNIVYLKFP